MRYEVEMIEKTKFVIEADDAIQAADYISEHSISEIEREQNLDLDKEFTDEILGVTIKPADFSIKENTNEIQS